MVLKYIIILLSIVVCELIYFKLALHYRITDQPNSRSSHKQETLSGGGIIFLLSTWIYAIFFGLEYSNFLIGMTAISCISFVDDIRPVPAHYRLIVHFLSIAMLLKSIVFTGMVSWWIYIIVIIGGVGVINAFNFMDGINGITGSYSIMVLLPLIYVNSHIGFVDASFLIVCMISLMIFNYFNFRKKAKCFAGDVGSIGIAFIIIFALGKLIVAQHDISYLVFLAVYGVDTLMTIVHRIWLKENITKPHRKHLFQLMANEMGMEHLKVSLTYSITQLIISLGMIFIDINHYLYAATIIAVLTAIYWLTINKFYHLHRDSLKIQKH